MKIAFELRVHAELSGTDGLRTLTRSGALRTRARKKTISKTLTPVLTRLEIPPSTRGSVTMPRAVDKDVSLRWSLRPRWLGVGANRLELVHKLNLVHLELISGSFVGTGGSCPGTFLTPNNPPFAADGPVDAFIEEEGHRILRFSRGAY
ncbi:hypothetical protein OE88DRAFT_1732917 [Heliocybe sulcata]|uniref:Uncharacterized protein n=1 Tax=Heliocybe sulcata TaxID=5364 RepID=A0A5C3NBH8_9AGAM|nr:hypothetical protein OE88DRAFT_1732917 [Heliocybe sulcata]